MSLKTALQKQKNDYTAAKDATAEDGLEAGVDEVTRANNAGPLISAAVGLGIGVIILLLMILISGEFAAAIPASGAFSNASNETENHGNTAYEIMAVALLVLPVGAVLGTLGGYLTGWVSFGNNKR